MGDVAQLKSAVLAAGVPLQDLITTAWGAAATFRQTDKRGGANGARIRLAPQKDWPVNQPQTLSKVLAALKKVPSNFNKGDKQVSIADLIVLAGTAAVEKCAKDAGSNVTVPFMPGRTDATAEQTEVTLSRIWSRNRTVS